MNDQDQKDFEAWKAARDAAEQAARPRQYYVHLADGQVVTLGQDELNAAGSHVNGIAVTATYEVGA